MTTLRLRNARDRLSLAVRAIADGEAGPEQLLAAQHTLARASEGPSPTALANATRQTADIINQLPADARECVRRSLDQVDSEAPAHDAFRQFSSDCYDAAWSRGW